MGSIWKGLLLLAGLLAVACHRDEVEETADLTICLDIPGLTKADSMGNTDAENAEETLINDLRIWVFRSSDGLPLGYIKPVSKSSKDPLTGFENRYHISLPAEVAKAHPEVDVYVVANAPVMGLDALNGNYTRAQLEAQVMGGNKFGIQNNLPVATAASNGLPFTGVGKNMDMKGSYPVMRVDAVTVRRMVSKLRFVFSQLTDAAADEDNPVVDFNLEELSIGTLQGDSQENYSIVGNAIVANEYLFSSGNYGSGSYDPSTINYFGNSGTVRLPARTDIALNPSPREYAVTSGKTAQEYESMIMQGIEDGLLTDFGKCYLRETDKALSGVIKYSIPGIEGQKKVFFTIAAAGDFVRNRSCIVYIFFLRDAMEFQIQWTPWETGYSFTLTK